MKNKISAFIGCISVIIVIKESYKIGKDVFDARVECNKLRIMEKYKNYGKIDLIFYINLLSNKSY